jgi:hypothetical protein
MLQCVTLQFLLTGFLTSTAWGWEMAGMGAERLDRGEAGFGELSGFGY